MDSHIFFSKAELKGKEGDSNSGRDGEMLSKVTGVTINYSGRCNLNNTSKKLRTLLICPGNQSVFSIAMTRWTKLLI